MRRVAEEIIEQRAIDIFFSENPPDVHWDGRMNDGQARIISEEERNLYPNRAAEQLTGELATASRSSLQP